ACCGRRPGAAVGSAWREYEDGVLRIQVPSQLATVDAVGKVVAVEKEETWSGAGVAYRHDGGSVCRLAECERGEPLDGGFALGEKRGGRDGVPHELLDRIHHQHRPKRITAEIEEGVRDTDRRDVH